MKLNKKIVALNVLATLFASEAMAAPITAVRTKTDPDSNSSGSTSGVATEVKTSKAREQQVLNVKARETAQCSMDQGPSKHFPLKLLSLLTRDGDDITIEKKSDGVASVKIPAIIQACGKFVPEIKQDKVSKNVTVLMTLVGTRTTKEMVDGVEKSTVTPNVQLTYAEFEECLTEKKILVDGQINHDKINEDKNLSNIYKSAEYEIDYEFNKKNDITKSISLTFGFPVAFGKDYGAKHAYDKDVAVPGEACMVAENVSDKKVLLNKGREDYIQDFINACKSGNASEIEIARRDLGNAEALKDIADKIRAELDAGYLVAVRKDVEKIYKELEKIEDKLNNPKEMDEKKARDLMAKYAEQLKLLDSIFLDKAISRVKELLVQREKLDEDSPEVAAIDEEIKTLNTQIGEFSNRSNLNPVYLTLEHFFLKGSAEVVESIFLKSKTYSNVNAAKNGLSIEEAVKKHNEEYKKFKPVLAEWEEAHQVRKGNQAPVVKAQREIQNAMVRKNSRLQAFRKKEMEDYNSYCTANMLGMMKNKTRCTEFFAGKDKRERAQLKRYESDMKFISAKERKLNKFAQAYGDFESKRSAHQERNEVERYEGASASGFEEDFNERFSSFSGSTQPGFVDPNMFSMGAPSFGQSQFGQPQMFQQQPQMMMGQQQMMPGFQQPMMGQQMGGGWPSM